MNAPKAPISPDHLFTLLTLIVPTKVIAMAAGLCAILFLAHLNAATPATEERIAHNQSIESALDATLLFFLRQQNEDGSWSMQGNQQADCVVNDDEPGYTNLEGSIALTSLVIQLFNAQGHNPSERGTFQKPLKKGLEWLLKQQDQRGTFPKRNYAHAMATNTLLILAQDNRKLRKPASAAMKTLLERQSNIGAWDYKGPNDRRSDFSITAWAAMVLHTARQQKLRLGDPEKRLRNITLQAWETCNDNLNKDDMDHGKAGFPYTYSDDGRYKNNNRTYLGLSICHSLGLPASNKVVTSLSKAVLQTSQDKHSKLNFSRWPCNLYALYHAAHGMQALPTQQDWRTMVATMLIANQQQQSEKPNENCLIGSWSTGNYNSFHGSDAGRMLSTVLAGLTLTCCLAE